MWNNQFSYFTLRLKTAAHFVCCSVFRSISVNDFLGFLLCESSRILWGHCYGLPFVLLILPECSFLMHSPPLLYKLVLLYGCKCLQIAALAQTSLRYRKTHLNDISDEDPHMQWKDAKEITRLACSWVVNHERRHFFIFSFLSNWWLGRFQLLWNK